MSTPTSALVVIFVIAPMFLFAFVVGETGDSADTPSTGEGTGGWTRATYAAASDQQLKEIAIGPTIEFVARDGRLWPVTPVQTTGFDGVELVSADGLVLATAFGCVHQDCENGWSQLSWFDDPAVHAFFMPRKAAEQWLSGLPECPGCTVTTQVVHSNGAFVFEGPRNHFRLTYAAGTNLSIAVSTETEQWSLLDITHIEQPDVVLPTPAEDATPPAAQTFVKGVPRSGEAPNPHATIEEAMQATAATFEAADGMSRVSITTLVRRHDVTMSDGVQTTIEVQPKPRTAVGPVSRLEWHAGIALLNGTPLGPSWQESTYESTPLHDAACSSHSLPLWDGYRHGHRLGLIGMDEADSVDLLAEPAGCRIYAYGRIIPVSPTIKKSEAVSMEATTGLFESADWWTGPSP